MSFLAGAVFTWRTSSKCPACGAAIFTVVIQRRSLHRYVVLACKHMSNAHIDDAPQVAVPAALGVAALIAGQFGGGLMMLAMAALAGLAFYLW